MTYRTKRPRLRSILTFGVGATLAITQLGAGCVPPGRYRQCDSADAASEGGDCVDPGAVSTSGPSVDGGASDAKPK